MQSKRDEIRPTETFFKVVMKPLIWVAPKTYGIPASTMAQAILNKTLIPATEKFEILENKTMHSAAAN